MFAIKGIFEIFIKYVYNFSSFSQSGTEYAGGHVQLKYPVDALKRHEP